MSTASLIEKMMKNTQIKSSAMIEDSDVFGKKDPVVTGVPAINIALSGTVDGGLTPGLLTLAGPSKHFKTAFALLMAAAFQRKYKDGVILFYDSEFGSPLQYFQSFGIDMGRVFHTPLTNIEELKTDIANQLEGFTKTDNVFILIDSIGNLASKKEAEDAVDGKSVADMTRAKQLKSLFRIITPHLNLKDIPMVVVNHTYKTLELYAKDVVGGGTGSYYSSDAIWIIGRQQDKETSGDKKLNGYDFIINIEKSRHVKEKSKIPVNVTFEGGIDRYSGLFDMAKDAGFIENVSKGWWAVIDPDTGEVEEGKRRESEIQEDKQFFKKLVKSDRFKKYVEDTYKIATSIHDIELEGEDA